MAPTTERWRREADLALALVAFIDPRTPTRIAALLASEGRRGLSQRLGAMPESERAVTEARAAELAAADVSVTMLGDPDYPSRLRDLPTPPPIVFYVGNLALADGPAVGMCGSRHASDLGLRAARRCGEEVARRGMTIVSGYAKGVDTESHLAALTTDGRTIIVLAEGIVHFRTKREFRGLFDWSRVLVLSQFAPSQPWSAGAAMTRNGVIVALGEALVVVEAGERGGTIAAGDLALRVGRPLFVLHFNGDTPPGNLDLLRRGGTGITSREALGVAVTALADSAASSRAPQQLAL